MRGHYKGLILEIACSGWLHMFVCASFAVTYMAFGVRMHVYKPHSGVNY